jgi:hypothetical protein
MMEYFEVKLVLPNLKPGIRDGLIFSLTVFCLLFNSCSTVRILPEEKTLRDKYLRTYPVDFSTFHPKMNSALQEYSQKHKGNSFRVVRLGSDGVMIRGYFKSEGNQERFSAEMAFKPSGQQKTRLEIKLSTPNPKLAADFLEKAYQELFQIVERGTGVAPQG